MNKKTLSEKIEIEKQGMGQSFDTTFGVTSSIGTQQQEIIDLRKRVALLELQLATTIRYIDSL